MRICIISDLHANMEALSALPNDYDELWVLGDLVNYGPNPAEIIDFVRSRASMIVRGNHDHSVGFGAQCGCSPRFRALAEATRDYTSSVLSAADKQFSTRPSNLRMASSRRPGVLPLPRDSIGLPLRVPTAGFAAVGTRRGGRRGSECCSRG